MAAGARRGVVPGMWHSPQYLFGAFGNMNVIDGQGDLVGRKLIALRCGGTGSSADTWSGFTFVDLTGKDGDWV